MNTWAGQIDRANNSFFQDRFFLTSQHSPLFDREGFWPALHI